MLQDFRITTLYCLPALLASSFILYSYYNRTVSVEKYIVSVAATCPESLGISTLSNDNSNKRNLTELRYQQLCNYHRRIQTGPLSPEKIKTAESSSDTPIWYFLLADESLNSDSTMEENVRNITVKIWFSNAKVVLIVTLLPYLLMGIQLSRSKRINLGANELVDIANCNWLLKFLVALVISVGWLYIFNPEGRGISTLQQFLIKVDFKDLSSLPLFIQSKGNMSAVIAGFLGWYLHLIGYIFSKLIHHDVVSARVFNLLFKKFLVTYGVALVLPSTGLVEEGKGVGFFMFIIGLFPLSAMSLLIESASKYVNSNKKLDGYLTEIPGISRWQILRLEEEGVESMSSLANIEPNMIKNNLRMMSSLVEFWVDIAQLYSILGHQAYQEVKAHCITASEFVARVENDPEFTKTINEVVSVGQAEEIARLIKRTFGEKMI